MSNSKLDSQDLLNQYVNSLQGLQGNFHVLEQQVPVKRQIAYFKFSGKLRREQPPSSFPFSDERVEEIYTDLLNVEEDEYNMGKAEKRHLLSLLAISHSVKAFRCLQSYIEHPDPDVADWAAMALMECQLALESELSDEKQIYIATAMGGKGQKLRFSVVFYAKWGTSFLPYQRQTIEDELAFHLSQADCEIEQLKITDCYVQLRCLIPIKTDVQTLLNKVLMGCNEFGNFLENGYTISNVNELTEEEILQEIANKQNEGNQAGN